MLGAAVYDPKRTSAGSALWRLFCAMLRVGYSFSRDQHFGIAESYGRLRAQGSQLSFLKEGKPLRNSLISRLIVLSLNVAALCTVMRPKSGTSVSKYRDVDPGFVERSDILFCSSLSYAQMMCAD
jgi:hypothetical protein